MEQVRLREPVYLDQCRPWTCSNSMKSRVQLLISILNLSQFFLNWLSQGFAPLHIQVLLKRGVCKPVFLLVCRIPSRCIQIFYCFLKFDHGIKYEDFVLIFVRFYRSLDSINQVIIFSWLVSCFSQLILGLHNNKFFFFKFAILLIFCYFFYDETTY